MGMCFVVESESYVSIGRTSSKYAAVYFRRSVSEVLLLCGLYSSRGLALRPVACDVSHDLSQLCIAASCPLDPPSP